MSTKPFAEACERNKRPILAVLSERFDEPTDILEIGSGTGQHAVFFARSLPHLCWWPTERADQISGLQAWLDDAADLTNLEAPHVLDVLEPWPAVLREPRFGGAFSANTAHIMSWEAVEQLFIGVAQALAPEGRFCLYGPFRYANQHTAPSNERFDAFLRARDPLSGIRDVVDLERLGAHCGLRWVEDLEMPANNRVLVWQRTGEKDGSFS